MPTVIARIETDRPTHLLLTHQFSPEGLRQIGRSVNSTACITALQLCGQFTDAMMRELSDMLRTNTTLETLILRECNINLTQLDILALAIHQNIHSALVNIDLSDNPLGSYAGETLNSLLGHLTRLRLLDLQGTQLGDKGVELLAPRFHYLDCLQYLNLASNNIGKNGARALGKALQQNTSIVGLSLSDNQLQTKGIYFLTSYLRHHSSGLVEVNFANNNINASGARLLGKWLRSPRCEITRLFLNSNPLTPEGVTHIVNGIRRRRTFIMDVLDLSSCSIGRRGVQAVSHLIALGLIKSLSVSGNYLREDIRYIFYAMQNQSVSSLSASNTYLTSVGMKSLAKLLKTDRTLTELYLTDNRIGNSGFARLASALNENKQSSLKTVSMGYTGITEFPDKVSIQKLNVAHLSLFGNKLSKTEARKFLSNSNICSLHLANTTPEAIGDNELQEHIDQNHRNHERSSWNWMRLCVLIASIRATPGSMLTYSILPLINVITSLTQEPLMTYVDGQKGHEHISRMEFRR